MSVNGCVWRCVWRCPQCKTTTSIREGIFFYQVQDSSDEVMCAKDATEEAEVDINTACDIYRYSF